MRCLSLWERWQRVSVDGEGEAATGGAGASAPERAEVRNHFLSRLSLLAAQAVPTVWNTCTMSTSSTTHTIMMLV